MPKNFGKSMQNKKSAKKSSPAKIKKKTAAGAKVLGKKLSGRAAKKKMAR
jgi:hypothetical protein